MKRVIALALAIPLLLAGCMFPQGWHWPRTTTSGSSTAETVVYWQNNAISTQASVIGWAAGYYNGHPELKIVVTTNCPLHSNCIRWQTGQNGGGVTGIGIGADKHLLDAVVTLDDAVANNTSGRLITFHEACHAFGGGFTPPGSASIHEFCNWYWRALIFSEISKVYHDDPG